MEQVKSHSHIGLTAVALAVLAALCLSCTCGRALDPASLRGLPLEKLQQMREEILARHADGSALTKRETADVEAIRSQERRLQNAWVFGEWQDRHGARLIFRDDGTVSVGARGGVYDEWGVYKFVSPEEPSYESNWNVTYDASGDPVVLVDRREGGCFLYPFHDSRKLVHECLGDLQTAQETGFLFMKIQ